MPGLCRLASRCCAHEPWGRLGPDPTEVEAIGVPAAADRGIVGMVAVGVPSAGINEEIESLVFEIEKLAAQFSCVRRAPLPVVRVGPLVDAAGIVEPSEESHHEYVSTGSLREPEPVALDASPVRRAVDGVIAEGESARDSAGEGGEVAVAVVLVHFSGMQLSFLPA